MKKKKGLKLWGWKDSLVGKMPDLILQNPHQQAGLIAFTCKPGTGVGETQGARWSDSLAESVSSSSEERTRFSGSSKKMRMERD